MAAYSHQELNIKRFTSESNYERALRAGRLHYASHHRIREVPLDDSFPSYVLQHPEAFAHLMAPPGVVGSSLKDLALLRATHTLVRFRERVRRRLWREWKQRFGAS
jgi:hypothetical protein